MEYKAPDNHIIESSPSGPVIYQCNVEGYVDGVYESYETTGASTSVGIKQIKITRTVDNNVMTIVVVESTEQELIDYKNSLSI